MKTTDLLLLGIVGYFVYQHLSRPASPYPDYGPNQPSGSYSPNGGIDWVSCDSPFADPVMCRLISGGRIDN